MKKFLLYFIWVILSSFSSLLSIILLNIQTIPYVKNLNLFNKLMVTEILVTIMWGTGIPILRFGYLVLNPVQLNIAGQLTGFIVQLLVTAYWFNLVTPIDDYIAIALIMLGLIVSKTNFLN